MESGRRTSFGPVVACTGLSENEVVGAEKRAKGTRSERVHGAGLKINEYGAGDILAGWLDGRGVSTTRDFNNQRTTFELRRTSGAVVVHADPVKLEIGVVALVAAQDGQDEMSGGREAGWGVANSPSIILDPMFIRDDLPELGTCLSGTRQRAGPHRAGARPAPIWLPHCWRRKAKVETTGQLHEAHSKNRIATPRGATYLAGLQVNDFAHSEQKRETRLRVSTRANDNENTRWARRRLIEATNGAIRRRDGRRYAVLVARWTRGVAVRDEGEGDLLGGGMRGGGSKWTALSLSNSKPGGGGCRSCLKACINFLIIFPSSPSSNSYLYARVVHQSSLV